VRRFSEQPQKAQETQDHGAAPLFVHFVLFVVTLFFVAVTPRKEHGAPIRCNGAIPDRKWYKMLNNKI
jgi:hypothetical protein